MTKCILCEKSFKSDRGLKSHIGKIHSGKKQVAWNKGLTNETSQIVANISRIVSEVAQKAKLQQIKEKKLVVNFCENCNDEHNGLFASGRFCCDKCSKTFSTKNNRELINKKVSETLMNKHANNHLDRIMSLSRQELEQAVANNSTITGLCETLSVSRGRLKTIKSQCNKHKIDYSHLEHIRANKQLILEKIFRIFNSSKEKGFNSYRQALIQTGRKKICELCNIGEEWNGKKLVLQVDHIDGNQYNHLESNFRYLCPNCHSQTDTFTSKNIKIQKEKKKQLITA